MGKNGNPDFPSDEINLAKASNFDQTKPEISNLSYTDDQIAGHLPEQLFDDNEELGIPKFLLKNNSADTAAFEDDKFATRSMRMVQDAVRTLADVPDPQAGMAAPVIASQQNANNGKWKIPATFAALAISIGGYFAYQSGNLDAIASFAQKQDNKPVLASNGFAARNENSSVAPGSIAQADIVQESDGDVSASRIVDSAYATISDPVVKLNGDQFNSLKARLGNEAPKPATTHTDKVETASLKRQQLAALVAEQAPPKPKSTRSLDAVNNAARELEAEASNSASGNNDTNLIQPVKVTPVQIKLAQTSSSAEDKLRALTNNVVDQLTRLKKFEENPETSEIPETQDLRNSINQLVQQASAQNLDSSAIEELLQEALANSNAVPQALARADGKLDTRLLLMSVLSEVDSSQVKSSDTEYLAALNDEGSTTVVGTSLADLPAASSQENARIKTVNGTKTIIVKVGDTLSKIAFAVYGDALSYTRIFKANRKLLKSPNLLTIDMVLVLP